MRKKYENLKRKTKTIADNIKPIRTYQKEYLVPAFTKPVIRKGNRFGITCSYLKGTVILLYLW